MPNIKTLFFTSAFIAVSVLGLAHTFNNTGHSVVSCDVVVTTSDDLDALADANPENTVFCIEAGIHYETSVTPKSGQQFIGDYGAVLSGARVLDPVAAIDTSGVGSGPWYWTGQTQAGMQHGSIKSGGNPMDRYPEDVFVDNTTWLTQVDSLANLDQSGEWYFDYAADRIYLYDDPSSFSLIETSVEDTAIAPVWWEYADASEFPDDVVVDNLVIEKYANPAQFGAIGAQSYGPAGNGSDSWQIRNVESRYNHGCGIRIVNGGLLENSSIHNNGQIGVCGSGESDEGAMPMTMRNNNVFENLVLDFSWGWEGGAMKFSLTDGMTVENNWVHDNAGPGIWYDINNYNAVIESNLVEDNEEQGIFYEISYGPALITCNQSLNNGVGAIGDNGAGVFISSSDGDSGEIVIRDNLIDGNKWGILMHSELLNNGRYDDLNGNGSRDPGEPYYEVDKLNIQNNEIGAVNDYWLIHLRTNQTSIATGQPTTYTIDNNVYYTDEGGAGAGSSDDDWLFRYNTEPDSSNPLNFYNFVEWQTNTEEYGGFDANSTNLDSDLQSPSLPASCLSPFTPSTYGPVNTNPTVAISSPANGSTVTDTVTVSATADDDFQIDRVEFTFDGSLIATDTAAPYSFDLNTTLYADGSYPLQAEVFDSLGNSTTDSISMTIANADTTDPTVSITSPNNNAKLTTTTSITANASDDVAVDRVEFTINGSLLASDTTAPYSASLNPANYNNINYTLTATAYDSSGNSSVDAITVQIANVTAGDDEEQDSNNNSGDTSSDQPTNSDDESENTDETEADQSDASELQDETTPATPVDQPFNNSPSPSPNQQNVEPEEPATFLGIELTPPIIISFTAVPITLGVVGLFIRRIILP